jgi:hypothetical protein
VTRQDPSQQILAICDGAQPLAEPAVVESTLSPPRDPTGRPATDAPAAADNVISLASPPAVGGSPKKSARRPRSRAQRASSKSAQAEQADGPVEAADEPPQLRAGGYDVAKINSDYALVLLGSRAVVVKEQPGGPIEDRVRVLAIEAFDHWFSNHFTEVTGADGRRRMITWSKAWRSDKGRRQYSGIEFFPNPDGAQSAEGYLNLWRGVSVVPASSGSWTIFRDHLFNNVCEGNQALFDWVFGWFAHIVQCPRDRIGTALVLRGRQGAGKTKIGEVIGSLFPAHYFQVDDPRYIVGNFNAHMASCLLLQAEEAVWAGDKHAEGRLKGLITSESQMIEAKGIDPIRIRNFVRVLMTSNEDWVVPAGLGERRFCVLDVHPRCAENAAYFREMQEELDNGGRERLLFDLQKFDLSSINLRQIPRTAALLEQKVRSLDALHSWWLARLMDGAPMRSLESWPLHVAKDSFYSDYVRYADEIGARRKNDPPTFAKRLRKIAPGLDETRPRIEVEPGVTRRVRSFVLPPLDECRTAFDAQLGQKFEWFADLQPSESEVVAAQIANEEVAF